jgi:lysophospholipase L1-like esterase
MVKTILLGCFMLLSTTAPETKKVKIFLVGDSTMEIKKATKFPENGWGMSFSYFFDSTVEVLNRAKGGTSTKTYREEGFWQPLINEVGKDDYVFIEFGHNDGWDGDMSRFVTPDVYKNNLIKFVREVKAKLAIPVLFTPVAQREFDSTGKAIETHLLYAPRVAEVALEENVAFIDLNKNTRELYQQFGDENSKLLFMYLKKGEHPNYPNGVADKNHFSDYGARHVAELVLQELKRLNIGLTERVRLPYTE